MRDDVRAPVQDETRPAYSQDLIAAVAQHYKLLILGPLLVAIATLLVVSLLPPKFASIGYLKIDKSAARALEATITSPTIASAVLAKYPGTGSTPETRVKYLARNLVIADTEPQGDRTLVRLFRMQISNGDPATAVAINKDLIQAWLESTVPGPLEQRNIKEKIARETASAESSTASIARLRSEAINIVLPNSLAGELATPLAALIAKRDASLQLVADLTDRLAGVSSDVIVVPPHLPTDSTSPDTAGYVLLAMLASIPIFLGLVALFPFIAASRRRLRA